MNDGLVEILGAVSGFFAAFGDAITVLIAASTTAVAGSLSYFAFGLILFPSKAIVSPGCSCRNGTPCFLSA